MKRYTYYIISCITLLFLSNSCNKETVTPSADNTVNDWIYSTMISRYYWSDKIPTKGKLNFKSDPELFFESLLSNSDGKHNADKSYYYSWIENTNKETRSGSIEESYGFIPIFYLYSNSQNVYMRVQYVVHGSAAASVGIKRGDTFSKFNGQQLTRSNYRQFADGKSAVELQRVKLSIVGNSVTAQNIDVINLPAAQEIEINPFYSHTTLTVDGIMISYLVYGAFDRGKLDNSNEYESQMRQIFSEFKSNPANVFVLDLRHNSGGYVSCAQQLATYLAPTGSLNGNLGYLEYRDGRRSTLNFVQNEKSNNLNLSKLYIVVSSTTASASELIINGLKPYFGDNLIIVGLTTEGKNVASQEYKGTGNTAGWSMHPITSKVFNSRGESGYENGFTPLPNHRVNEYDATTNRYAEWYELGDPREYLLKNVISVIKTGSVENPLSRTKAGLFSKDEVVIIPRKSSSLIMDSI